MAIELPELPRLSDHFVARQEWQEIDRRARLGAKPKAGLHIHRGTLYREMALAWWLLSVKSGFDTLRALMPVAAQSPQLHLLEPSWFWLERWVKFRDKTGINFTTAPLFCTTRFGVREWPRRLQRPQLPAITRKLACGSVTAPMLLKLRTAYAAEPRINRKAWSIITSAR